MPGAHVLFPGQRAKAATAGAANQQLTGDVMEALGGGGGRQVAVDKLGGDFGEALECGWRRQAGILCLVQEGADAVG